MKWIKWLEETNETLLDLIFGCLVYSLVFEIAGLLLVSNKGSYSLGLLLGTIVAVGMSVSMERGLERCLNMDEIKGQRFMTLRSILRSVVMLVAAWVGMRFDQISFPGVIVGILGLKISAYLHMYTNLYITKKLKRKGR
ncbi:MAG: ATP synthase subunit I [Clostridiales bacterium]|nr:ATP synthase subunit I [Clostridiales bacterium]